MNDRDQQKLFDLARQRRPQPSEALMARVMADALAAQPRSTAPAEGKALLSQPGLAARFWRGLTAGFGGSGVVASLGIVAAAALVLGYSAPASVAADLFFAGESEAGGGFEIVPVAEYFLAGG